MRPAGWRSVLADPEVRRAIEQAARTCMQLACNHEHRNHNNRPTTDPSYCDCAVNRMTPLEFLEFINDEIRGSGTGRSQPAGQPNRTRASDPRLNLAVAI